MIFEPLKYEHLDQMVEIEKEAFDAPWSRNMFIPEVADPNAHYIVGVRGNGEVLCYGGFHKVLDEAHITNIAVKNTERGKGFGKLLLSMLIGNARDIGAMHITLEVKDINSRAINLYKSFGFKIEGIRKRYYDNKNDAYIMWLHLDE